ncbi:MAG: polyamine aminopropyltransferase [Myxococcales bacterium]|nr:polyamine aminopropyltransferase [Myxococcales bacterium]
MAPSLADEGQLGSDQVGALLASVFVVAVWLSYELMMGALATTLLGGSILWFSLTIGVFLSAMGMGSFFSRFVPDDRLLEWFVGAEIAIGLVGGTSGLVVFGAYTWTPWVHVALFGCLGLIGALVGLELPVLTRFLQPVGGLRTAIANVMALDYLGSLAASLAFPFLMLPYLGLLESFFAVGLLNLLAASATLLAFRDRMSLALPLGVTALLAILLAAGLAEAESTMSRFERQLYSDPVIHVEQTPYQRLVLTKRSDDLRLYIDGHLQFAAKDEYRYHEALVHPAMAAADHPARVLVLGGGDGLAVQRVLAHPGVAQVDLVDLDPRVVSLFRDVPRLSALNGGALSDPRVTVHAEDAVRFLERAEARWDVIVMDLPDPHDAALARLYSQGTFALALRRLDDGGALVTQATSPFFAREAFWCIATTLEAAVADGPVPRAVHPGHVHVPSFGTWGVVLVTSAGVDPAELSVDVPVRFLDGAAMAGMWALPKDLSRVPVEVNRLGTGVLATYYRRGWRHARQ